MKPAHADASILIVDDEPANVTLLDRALRGAGYWRLAATTDPRRAVEMYRAQRPDIVLLDLHMPHLDGFAVLAEIDRATPVDDDVPVLVLTADVTLEARRLALRSGARDFVTKPFDLVEVLLRVANLLRSRSRQLHLAGENGRLLSELRLQARDTEQARIETLDRLAVAAEIRDDETGAHVTRVGRVAEAVATVLGLPAEEAATIGRAARLHDLGKIGVPDHILTKPGALTDEEWIVMRTHTTMGRQILDGSSSPMLRLAAEIAATHHERWDGGGYPSALRGERIPLAGRITTVADTWDAMTTTRRYRAARSVAEALDEIARVSGTQFDPACAAALPAALKIIQTGIGSTPSTVTAAPGSTPSSSPAAVSSARS